MKIFHLLSRSAARSRRLSSMIHHLNHLVQLSGLSWIFSLSFLSHCGIFCVSYHVYPPFQAPFCLIFLQIWTFFSCCLCPELFFGLDLVSLIGKQLMLHRHGDLFTNMEREFLSVYLRYLFIEMSFRDLESNLSH